ncbi:MAG: hypothetical protein WC889_02855 [Myxococcota bacterium]|jgi:hypothetical protein
MADATDWSTLFARCADHGAWLVLRVETIKGEVRFSLSAIGKSKDAPRHYDLRRNIDDNAPQFVVTTLVTQALEEWWA